MPSDAQIARFRKAAERGDADAQYELGCRYANGRGVPQDNAEAAKWYQKAAEQGNADAQNNLGWMCETGRGVPLDPDAAMEWYRKAAAQGKEAAKANLARLGASLGRQDNDQPATPGHQVGPNPAAPSPPPLTPARQNSPHPTPHQGTLPLDGTVVGSCPKCGSDVLEGGTGYFCRARDCRFKLAGVILGQILTSSQASKLLQDGRTDMLPGFVSEAGRQFSASLVIDKAGKVTFDFPKQEPQEVAPPQKPAAASKRRPTDECKPLIAAATKDLFRTNAFRITGLPVDASVRDITKNEAWLTQVAKLDHWDKANTFAFALKPPPTPAQLQDAHQKLKDPEQRLLDEFFWFWPEEFGQSRNDPAIQALQAGDGDTAFAIWSRKEDDSTSGRVAMHNVALVWHLTALEWEGYTNNGTPAPDRQAKLEQYWHSALKHWAYLIKDDSFWDHVTARIRQINEPDRLPVGFARRMRATLPHALCKINAELALSYVAAGSLDLAELHVGFMRQASHGPENAEKAAELVLTPARKRLQEQIRRAKECADSTPREAHTAARQLLKQTGQTMVAFDMLLGEENASRNELADEAAGVCNRLILAYQKETDDHQTSVEILAEAISFAASPQLSDVLVHNLRWFTLSLIGESQDHPSSRLDRFTREGIPTPAESANQNPNSDTSLFDHAASVLRGISLNAWNDYNDSATAVTANGLAITYACEPDLKQRLLEDRATLTRNLGHAPSRPPYTPPRPPPEQEPSPDQALKRLQCIKDSQDSPKAKLDRVRSELMPELEALRKRRGAYSDPVRRMSDNIAGLLTLISVEAYTDRQDLPTAMDAVDSARLLCFNSLLKTRIEQHVAAVQQALAQTRQPAQATQPAPNQPKASRNVAGVVVLVVVAILILFGIIGSCDSTNTPSSTTTYTAPVPSAPTYTPPQPSGGSSPAGNVYRVPSSVSSTLKSEKAEIESERASLEALEAQVETLGREIDSDRLYLDRTSQYAVDEFNAKVARCNSLAQRAKLATAVFNQKVDNYNAKLRQSAQ